MTGLRVLFVTHGYPRFPTDVAGSFLHRLAVALRAGGAELRVLAPSAPGLAISQELEGIGISRFRYAPSRYETLAYTGTMAEQVQRGLFGKGALAGLLAAGTLALRREIRSFRPDVIHAHWWFPAGLLATAATSDVPVVTTLHGSDVRLARNATLAHPLFRRVISRSAAVTAVSSWLAGEARAIAPSALIRIAPMPTDTTSFGSEGGARIPGRFLFVGRLNAQKGIEDLLEAFAWTGADTSLDVIGEGPLEAKAKALAARLGIAARVRWHGQLDRTSLAAMYQRAHAVVIPSLHEGLGLVAVEAQLSRTPVIAYRSGGLPDVVSSEWGGILVPSGDRRALANAMRGVLANPDHVRLFGASARSAMVDRFAPSTVAASYRALYDSVLRYDA